MSRNYVFKDIDLNSKSFGQNNNKSKFEEDQFDFNDQVTHHVYNADKYTKEEVTELFKKEYEVEPVTIKIIAVRYIPGFQGGYFTCDINQKGAFKCWHLCEDYC